jgi:HK97 family phage major capsid protein
MRGNHYQEALGQYDGQVPTPFAVYRPPVLGGFVGALAAFMLGVCAADGGSRFYGQLIDRKAALKAEEDSILAAAEAAGSVLTAEQRVRLKAIDTEFEALAADIGREEARRERERSAPAADASASRTVIETIAMSPSDKAPTPFKSLGEQLQAVRQAAVNKQTGLAPDNRLAILMDYEQAVQKAAGPSGASESVGSDGGFLVQTDISNELLANTYDTGKLTRLARHIPIGPNSNGVTINVIDETSRATGSRWGGVQAYWVAEGASLTASRPKFKPLRMQLGKLIGLFYPTDELLSDAVALTAVADEAFTEEFGFQLDDAMVEGTGAGIPLGVLNSGGLVTVAKETGQAAGTLVAENFMKMYPRMKSSSLDRAAWYINQECWPQIFQLAQVIGTGGIPLYVPAGQFSSAPNGSILGRPIVPIEQASAIGTVGDVIFADWNEYVIIEKGGIVQASSIHVLFLTDEMTFRWTLRTNGQPRRNNVITPFKGSNSVSPFVALATR